MRHEPRIMLRYTFNSRNTNQLAFTPTYFERVVLEYDLLEMALSWPFA